MEITAARLQVWTEFYSTNNPDISFDPGAVTNLSDPYLDFGGMQMAHGQAYLLLGTNLVSTDKATRFDVTKTWVKVGTRRFLREEIPYALIQDALNSLDASTNGNGLTGMVIPKLQSATNLAWLPPQRPVSHQTNVMQIAYNLPTTKEFVMDYSMLITGAKTAFTFRADTPIL